MGTAARKVREWAAPTVLVGIAFLLGLSTARNADVWSHLASGRDAVSGLWTGLHALSCLANAVMFLTFSTLGGPGLVVGKAFVVAATAAVMAGAGATSRTVVGVLLAVFALGAWLPLNPICVSYLFVAITLSALDRLQSGDAIGGWGRRPWSHWTSFLAYIVWANADVWCLLGVALVGMHAVARSVARVARGEPFDWEPWRLFALLAAASACGPIPWHVSTVAREFGHQLTNADPALSPFRADFARGLRDRQLLGAVPAAAFWLLVGIGLLSFRQVEKGKAWVRFVPWIGLFLASAFDVRFAPFFVVVGGATLARNIRDTYVDASGDSAVETPMSRGDRLRAVIRASVFGTTAAGLLAAAWAGWLQSLPSERRNWTVEADPSLVRAADEVNRWYSTGALKANQRTVFFAQEAEDVFSWFAPAVGVSGPDSQRATGAERVRDAILLVERGSTGELADASVGCIVVSDPNRVPFAVALRNLNAFTEKWTLAHLRGRVAVFVRAGSGIESVNLTSRAYDPVTADRAPDKGEPAVTTPPQWSDPFVVPRPSRSIDRDESVTYLIHEETTRGRRMVGAAERFLAILAASVVGAPGCGPVGWAVDQRATILAVSGGNVPDPSRGPPPVAFGRFVAFLMLTDVSADHYLAVRAARRGVAAAPRDPGAYAALGEAYLYLLSDPLESNWGGDFPAIRRLRRVQAAAAFRQALVLDPGLSSAHFGLAQVYFEQQFLDLAAVEFSSFEQSARGAGQSPVHMAELARAVEAARQQVEANAANLSVLDRARLAERNGLQGMALDALLQSDVAAFGSAGIALEMDLLLAAGRADEARAWLAPEHRNALGGSVYDWLRVQTAAAAGDYAGATAVLRAQVETATPGAGQPISGAEFWAGADLVRKNVAKQPNGRQKVLTVLASLFGGLSGYGGQLAFESQTKTEAYLLLAVLALEQGDMTACAAHLESARSLWENIDKSGERFPSPARTVVRQMTSLIHR
ncbi:hypothetical protein FRUB_02857 [Fimbriiglobus ruber]|uniref:Uncharacterized protein n=1 Tax=Fimbriiglobus ruber TaxID=1908690 RepID=A0A225DXK2_9BACT|nr:hypothetical protein FRUB_02857 [Fimbriiglobus ruber]